MSKPAATTVFRSRIYIGRLCAVVSLLLSPVVVAAVPDPALRLSAQLDTRRLGKVSDDERSVLRVEWRAAASGAEEARTVAEMLDSLRRMEGTVGEINRLIRGMPVQKPVVAVAAVEPPESDGYDMRLAVANVAALCLVALWWFRRRNTASQSPPTRTVDATPMASPPLPALPDETLPSMAPPAETPPNAVSAPTSTPVAVAPLAPPRREAPRIEPSAPTEAVEAAPTSTKITQADREPEASPAPVEAKPTAPPPVADIPPIEFSLEEADPASVARANARVQKLEAIVRPDVPAKPRGINVDPTLELAEIMLSLGLQQGAAQTLVEYTEANPHQALAHWLKLLDIYRNSGHREDFKEAAEKLRQNFNIQAEEWAIASAADAPTLEQFSRIAEYVQNVWPRPAECIAYLRNLLEDNREGSRAGFPRPVAEEMLLLIDILKETSGTDQAVGT